jgi:hypothetical protein
MCLWLVLSRFQGTAIGPVASSKNDPSFPLLAWYNPPEMGFRRASVRLVPGEAASSIRVKTHISPRDNMPQSWT